MDLEEQFQQAETARIDGQYEDAITKYQQILDAEGEHLGSLVGLGLVYGFTGLFDESIELLEKAVALDPGNMMNLIHLGKTYVMLGMFDEGKGVFERVLAVDPNHDEAQKQMAYLKEFGF